MDFFSQKVDPSLPEFTVGFLLDQLGAQGRKGVTGGTVAELRTGGFLSSIFRLEVVHHDGRKQSYIFKVPNKEKMDAAVKYDPDSQRELVLWMHQVHNAECRFYTSLVPLLRSTTFALPFRIPQLFAARENKSEECLSDSFLFMEDLVSTGGFGLNQVQVADGLDRAQVESAIRSLAHFHALTLWLPPGVVESFTLKADLDFDDDKLHIVKRLMGMPDAEKQFRDQEPALRELYSRAGGYAPDQHKIFGIQPVIVHGDYWSNNMFFCSQSDRLDSVFDWQIVHSGTGVTDLLRVIFVCVNADLRRAHIKQWLEMYSEELNAKLTENGIASAGEGRQLEMIKRMAVHHCDYEMCFQIFLFTNILCGEKEEEKRRKLITRMAALFNDYKNGLLSK